MGAAASLARKAASAATCSTVTNWLVGCRDSTCFLACSIVMFSDLARSGICFSYSGVHTNPGDTALQVTPCSASSSATVLVKPASPCLADT